MSEHKLRKLVEYNARVKKLLEVPRIPVSQASQSLISYTQNTKDYLLPSIWGPPPQDPFASQTSGGCGCSVICGYIHTSSNPPASTILSHLAYRRYVKHATLVEKCFPVEKSGEAAPNSNELSYLVYYAQSKPAKLTKVGAYLSKRINKDIQRRRRADVVVGLNIYDALLSACGRDLNFFAKDVLGTLDAALATGSSEFSWAAARTFALYCRCHTGSTLAIDKDLRLVYSRLIKVFVTCAQTRLDGTADSTRKVVVGMRAINAVVKSQATYATDCYYELPRVVKAILNRIATAPKLLPDDDDGVEQQIESIRQSADTLPSEELLGQWAWHCLRILVRKSHGQHSHVIVAEIFKYLDGNLQWQPIALCVHVVTTVISQLQPQDQNMVIVETLAFLTDGKQSSQLYQDSSNVLNKIDTESTTHSLTSGKEGAADVRKSNRRRSCVIRILESLFCRPYILVGISVMEALNVLITFLLESAVDDQLLEADSMMFASTLDTASNDKTGDCAGRHPYDHVDAGATGGSAGLLDYYHLLAAVGGLASHQYYSGQLSDMVEYLVSKMGLAAENKDSSADADELSKKLQWLLQSLYMVALKSKSETSNSQCSTSVRLEVYSPLFTLLSHGRRDVRAYASDCIIEILRRNNECGTAIAWLPAWNTALTNAVYKKLGDSLARCHSRQSDPAADYSAVAAILYEVLHSQQRNVVQNTLLLLKDQAAGSVKASWISSLALVWSKLATICASTQLASHIRSVIDETKAHGCWDASIESVCYAKTRVVSIAATAAASNEPPALLSEDVANTLLDKLSYSSVSPMLEPELRQMDTDSSRSALEDPQPPAESTDHILCSTNSSKNRQQPQLQRAVEQVKDIRARVSIDWEAQAKRHSLLAPQINLDQLRAALRDGLIIRSSEYADSTEHSLDEQEPSIHHTQALRHDDAAEELDAHGRRIPDEVLDLLNSIDDVRAPSQVLGRDQEVSPTINTPVINNL
ncbi:plasma membrane localization protein [Dipsacomyces acuminosporus]|nr:plasma membrane localization protein [Dipsacomyces acuminosporus]